MIDEIAVSTIIIIITICMCTLIISVTRPDIGELRRAMYKMNDRIEELNRKIDYIKKAL